MTKTVKGENTNPMDKTSKNLDLVQQANIKIKTSIMLEINKSHLFPGIFAMDPLGQAFFLTYHLNLSK